jgi:hypothetical protein
MMDSITGQHQVGKAMVDVKTRCLMVRRYNL